MFREIVFIGLLAVVVGSGSADEPRRFPKQIEWETIRTIRHATDAFCQGLFFERSSETGEDCFYESDGRYGVSALRLVRAADGRTLRTEKLNRRFFGEGLTVVGDKIYQLTWQEQTCLIYDKKTFRLMDQFRYRGEGWGLTFDGALLILSDGTARLRFFDPDTFSETGAVSVTYHHARTGEKRPLTGLNELEYINGEIWANIYQTPFVARIDPSTGEVIEFLNFKSLIPRGYENDSEQVLNGIAWNDEAETFYLTGKNWPVLYELRIKQPAANERQVAP